jgi:hypothetical protein
LEHLFGDPNSKLVLLVFFVFLLSFSRLIAALLCLVSLFVGFPHFWSLVMPRAPGPTRSVEVLQARFLELTLENVALSLRDWTKTELVNFLLFFDLPAQMALSKALLIDRVVQEVVAIHSQILQTELVTGVDPSLVIEQQPAVAVDGLPDPAGADDRMEPSLGGLTQRQRVTGVSTDMLLQDDPPLRPAMKPRFGQKARLLIPEVSPLISEADVTIQRMQLQAERVFPDPKPEYSAHSKEEAKVIAKALRGLAILQGLLREELVTEEVMVDGIAKVMETLCQRLIQLEVFESEGWAVAKHVDLFEESFLKSDTVKNQMKEARKVASRFRDPKAGKGAKDKSKGGYSWAKPAQQAPQYAPYAPPTQQRVTFTGKKDISQVVCFNCHQAGHYKSNCPLPAGQGKKN